MHKACRTHCCILHGCKYGYNDCPVALELVKQAYPCDLCPTEEDVADAMSIIEDYNFITRHTA